MKHTNIGLLIVVVVALVWGVAPVPATPARAQAEVPALSSGPGEHDPRQAIADFVANADGPVGAEEIISFLNDKAETAATSEYPFGPVAVFNPAKTYLHIAAAKLTDTKFVVAYRDLGNFDYGMAIVGQVSGTDITYGAEYVFNAATTQYESVAALSDTKFVVAYWDGGNLGHGTAIVGQVAGSVISYGSEVVFNAASTEYASVAALSDTKFVVAYRDSVSTHGVVRVGEVTGTTISYGTAATFNSYDTYYISVAALSETKFVVAFRDADFFDYGFSMVGQVTDKAISYGAIAQFNSAGTFDVSVAALSETKFVVAYQDVGLSYGQARVGQVTGLGISYGPTATFNDAATRLYHSGGVARLSDTTFIVGYENTGDDDGRVIVGAVSGDAITFGNQVSYNAGSASYDVTVVALSESKYVVAWDDESTSDYGTARVGTVPTFGPAVIFNQNYTFNISAAKLTDTKFVVAYSNGVNYDGAAIVGQVTGTGITYGAVHVFDTVDTSDVSVAALSATKFVVAYTDEGHGTAIVGQVSNTTITYGAKYVFNARDTEYTSVAALSDTKFVVAYRDAGGSGHGVARVGQVSNTTITYGSGVAFNSASTDYTSVAALSATEFVVAYRDVDSSDRGEARVGQVTGTSITYGTESVFSTSAIQYASMAALSATKFVVAYQDGGNFDYGTAIVGQVAGTTITYGAAAVFNAADTKLHYSGGVARLSDTTFVVGYQNTDDDDGRVIVGAVWIGAITFGHGVSHNAGSDSSYVTVVPLTESRFVVAWCDRSSYEDYGTSKLGMLLPPLMVYLPLVLRN